MLRWGKVTQSIWKCSSLLHGLLGAGREEGEEEELGDPVKAKDLPASFNHYLSLQSQSLNRSPRLAISLISLLFHYLFLSFSR